MAATLQQFIKELKASFKAGSIAEIQVEGKTKEVKFKDAQSFVNFVLTQGGHNLEACKNLVEGVKEKPKNSKKEAAKEETKEETETK
jgi:hypothetical protein